MPDRGGGSVRKMGAQSSFNFGDGFGQVKAAFRVLRIAPTLVEAQSWKRSYGLLRTEKDDARKLMKSEEAKILAIKDGTVTVENRHGETVELKQNDKMLERMGLAYAINMHQAQGMTSDKGIGVMHSSERLLSNQRLTYVMATRVRGFLPTKSFRTAT